MMPNLVTFGQLGFRHIVNLGALDHILFLLALAAIYRRSDWRQCLWVVSAFTVGHSVTLALAATDTLALPTALIEFLIPATIVATGIDNLVGAPRRRATVVSWHRPLLAALFGLVHGAGFANYLRDVFSGSITAPLLGFNVGIELGQLVVLALAGIAFVAVDRLLARVGVPQTWLPAHRLRAAAVSATVVLVAAQMMIARRPW